MTVAGTFATLTVSGHEASLLCDGGQAYPAMLEAIAGARRTVCLETYILREDGTGRRFAAALSARAQAGVEVSLLYDDWGSSVSAAFLASLREAGVRTLAFRPVVFTGRFGRLLARLRRRDHRKALVVDGEVAFLGGLNLSDDYASVEDGGRGWRDTQVRLRGPAALEVQALFLDTWRRHRGAPIDPARYAATATRGSGVRVLGNAFRADRKEIGRAYLRAIRAAQQSIRLTHAYFVPPSALLRALRVAARRGVRVEVIIAGATDVPLALLAARGLYGKLLRAGVRIFEWQGRILHAKTAVVDGRWCTVGSANLDTLSLRANLEVNAVLDDPAFGAAMERLFQADLAHCAEVTLASWSRRPWYVRLLWSIAGRFRLWL